MRWWDVEELEDCDIFDSVRIERSHKVEDAEAAVFDALCRSASPGPFMIDDRADGDGIVVATLPDGRLNISVGSTAPVEDADVQAEANARLLCESRPMILRLLRDREAWYERERDLEDRIATLECRLAEMERMTEAPQPPPVQSRFSMPR